MRRPKPPASPLTSTALIDSTIVLRREDRDVRLPIVDVIIERVRTGAPRELVAESVGIDRSTLASWNKRGLKARDLREQNKPIPEDELAFLTFADRLAQADAEASIADYTRLALPREITRVVVDAEGKTITKTTTREGVNERVLMFRLRARHPEIFGERVTLQGDDEHPLSIDVGSVAARLADRLREVQTAARGNVIELPERVDENEKRPRRRRDTSAS